MRGRLLALFVLLASAAAGAQEPAAAGDRITAEALAMRLAEPSPGLVVLDVRSPDEFATGHIPGALNVPLDALGERLPELERFREAQLVVYCLSGIRSQATIKVLRTAGFRHLLQLAGDIGAWKQAGHPLATPSAAAP